METLLRYCTLATGITFSPSHLMNIKLSCCYQEGGAAGKGVASLTSRFECLVEQQRLQGGVQLFTHILQQHWQPKLNSILQRAQVLTTL